MQDRSLSDGTFFLELLSAVHPRSVNWSLVTKGLSGMYLFMWFVLNAQATLLSTCLSNPTAFLSKKPSIIASLLNLFGWSHFAMDFKPLALILGYCGQIRIHLLFEIPSP